MAGMGVGFGMGCRVEIIKFNDDETYSVYRDGWTHDKPIRIPRERLESRGKLFPTFPPTDLPNFIRPDAICSKHKSVYAEAETAIIRTIRGEHISFIGRNSSDNKRFFGIQKLDRFMESYGPGRPLTQWDRVDWCPLV